MQCAGSLIDVSTDLSREDGIARALQWCDELAQRQLSDSVSVLIEYFRANAWAARQQLKHRKKAALWNWEQPEVQEQILHLRRAMRHSVRRQIN